MLIKLTSNSISKPLSLPVLKDISSRNIEKILTLLENKNRNVRKLTLLVLTTLL